VEPNVTTAKKRKILLFFHVPWLQPSSCIAMCPSKPKVHYQKSIHPAEDDMHINICFTRFSYIIENHHIVLHKIACLPIHVQIIYVKSSLIIDCCLFSHAAMPYSARMPKCSLLIFLIKKRLCTLLYILLVADKGSLVWPSKPKTIPCLE
jgi:hypothetical protein